MSILLKKIKQLGIFILFQLTYSIVRTQQVKCYQYQDCSSDQCCIQGLCSKPTNNEIKNMCNSNKICYSKQCQYGCCNDKNECGSYEECQTSNRKVQITISISVGVVVFLLLLCYIFYSCRKSKRVEIQNIEEENSSNIENNDGTFINQTNNNQTQMVILNQNQNQTNITEYNQNNNNNSSIVIKPTHVLPPIQTIFLIDQQQDKPIYVEKKLQQKEVDQINYGIKGTKIQKEYYNRNNNRSTQRVNSSHQSEIQQYISEQRVSQQIQDMQQESFNRIEQQNERQHRKLNSNQQQHIEDNKNQDLLKNPDNYLYKILRQLKEQVFIKKFNMSHSESDHIKSNHDRQLRSESDINEKYITQKKKAYSLHNKLSERNQYKNDIEDSNNKNNQYHKQDEQENQKYQNNQYYYNEQNQKNLENEQMEQRKKKRLKNRSISSRYEQEIQLNRNAFEQYQQQQQSPINDVINIDKEDKIISSNRNQQDAFDKQSRQYRSNNNIDIQDSPFQGQTMVTPHTPNEQSDRQLNQTSKIYTLSNTNYNSHKQINSTTQHYLSDVNTNKQSRNSIQSNSLKSILQNQIKVEQDQPQQIKIENDNDNEQQININQQIDNQIDNQNEYSDRYEEQKENNIQKDMNINNTDKTQVETNKQIINNQESEHISQQMDQQDDFNLQTEQQNHNNNQIQNI